MGLHWANVASWRIRRQRLVERASQDEVVQVAGLLCGLHAQLMSSAELAVWARVEDLAPGDVSDLLWQRRELFKTWGMRGTLHLLPASEYALWQGGWAAYDHYLKGAWFKYFGVSAEELGELIDAIGSSLDGRMLTREQLAASVAGLTGSPHLAEKLKESWGALLKPASFQGKLCFAPNLERNVRFTLPSWWLGDQPPVEKDDALQEVARRFLEAHAPATREDFARWWGTTPAHAGLLLKRLEQEAVEVEVEGEKRWVLDRDVDETASAEPSGTVNLLPSFDHYVVGSTLHAERLLPDPSFKSRVYRPQGWISPVVLVDGRMEGVWEFEKKGARLTVSVQPFGRFPERVERGVASEAERLARFFGVSEVSVESSEDL